jgi:hypothetical protein
LECQIVETSSSIRNLIMAKQLAALLGGGLDLKALAEMLRRQGRGQDTILAHITPQEAALLKSRGGAGTMNPATGLPEFQEDPMNYGFGYEGDSYTQGVSTPNIATQDIYQPGNFPTEGEFGPSLPPVDMRGAITETGAMPDYTQDLYPAVAPAISTRSFQPQMPQAMPDQFVGPQQVRDFKQEAIDAGVQPQRSMEDLLKSGAKQVMEGLGTRQGLGLATAGLGALQARRGYQQARRMADELRQLGQQPRMVGEQQLGAGMRGELTPVQQQQIAAFQAQQRQALANRGATSGTAQQQLAARTVEMQQRGAQDLINQGLKNIGVSDQYLQRAILAGYQADQNVSNALADALQAAGYMMAGSASEQPTKTVTTPAQTQARTALTPPRG